MTRKHFVAIAQALQSARPAFEEEGVSCTCPSCLEALWNAAIDAAARELARSLSTFNPAFDRDRFLRAAGVEK